MRKNFKKSLSAVAVIALSVGFGYSEEEKPTTPELYISGYASQTYRLTNQKYGETIKNGTADSAFTAQYPSGNGFQYTSGYNQIYFNAGASTDSGFEYSANYEIDILPEIKPYRAYIEFGTGYGRIQLGKTSSAVYENLIDGSRALAGAGGWDGQSAVPMFDKDGVGHTNVGDRNGYFSPNISYQSDDYNKPAKIAFQSNKYNGLSFGYSFTPAGNTLVAAFDDSGAAQIDTSKSSADNSFVNVHNYTINYEHETTDFGIFLFGGAVVSKNSNEQYRGMRAFSMGAKFTKGDLEIAAGHHNFGRGGLHKLDAGNNGTITDVGVGYNFDDVKVGAGMGVFHGKNSNDELADFSFSGNSSKTTGTFYSVGASSEVAKGLSAFVELNQYRENKNKDVVGSTLLQQELMTGFSLSF